MLICYFTTSLANKDKHTAIHRYLFVHKADLFHFVTSHHLGTLKYEVRNKILSLKRLNNRNPTDRVSVFRATSKLQPCQTMIIKNIHVFFPLNHQRVRYLYKYFLVQTVKHLTQDFSGVYRCDLKPIGSSQRDISAKCCRLLWEVFIWFRERNAFYTFRKCKRFVRSLQFLMETSEQLKGRLLAVVTFCLFFPTRFVSS